MFQSLHQSLAVYLYDSYPHVQYISTDSNGFKFVSRLLFPKIAWCGNEFYWPKKRQPRWKAPRNWVRWTHCSGNKPWRRALLNKGNEVIWLCRPTVNAPCSICFICSICIWLIDMYCNLFWCSGTIFPCISSFAQNTAVSFMVHLMDWYRFIWFLLFLFSIYFIHVCMWLIDMYCNLFWYPFPHIIPFIACFCRYCWSYSWTRLMATQQRWNPSSAWANNRRANTKKTTFYNWCRKGTRTIGKPRATWNISNRIWFNWWGWPKKTQRARLLPGDEATKTGAERRPGGLIYMTLLLLADAIFFKNTFDTLVYFLTLVIFWHLFLFSSKYFL